MVKVEGVREGRCARGHFCLIQLAGLQQRCNFGVDLSAGDSQDRSAAAGFGMLVRCGAPAGPDTARAFDQHRVRGQFPDKLDSAGPCCRVAEVDFKPGRATTIIGESGSGKSLLAHAVVGTLPSTLAARGNLSVSGNSYDLADRANRRRLWGPVRGPAAPGTRPRRCRHAPEGFAGTGRRVPAGG